MVLFKKNAVMTMAFMIFEAQQVRLYSKFDFRRSI